MIKKFNLQNPRGDILLPDYFEGGNLELSSALMNHKNIGKKKLNSFHSY